MLSHNYSSDDVQLEKNSAGLIDGSQGFARCAQNLLATKTGGAMDIQKLWFE